MTPADLLQLSGGYWSTCALHAGVKLDIFTLLDCEPLDANRVAERLAASPRGVAMLLDALTALGLLRKETGIYHPTDSSRAFLSSTSDRYLGHIIMHHHHLVEGWSRLDRAVVSGGPVRVNSINGGDQDALESFLMGMHDLASLNAPKVVAAIDLTASRHLLDLGGGPGTYAIHFCKQNPELRATVFDLPSTRPFAERNVAAHGLADRIGFIAGDITTDRLPAEYDTVWLSQVLHSEGPAGAAAMLATAAFALKPGGRLFVQEFILEDDRCAPPFPALFSLNMLIGTGEGQSYSRSELAGLIADAGFSDILPLDVPLPNGAGIISARRP